MRAILSIRIYLKGAGPFRRLGTKSMQDLDLKMRPHLGVLGTQVNLVTGIANANLAYQSARACLGLS